LWKKHKNKEFNINNIWSKNLWGLVSWLIYIFPLILKNITETQKSIIEPSIHASNNNFRNVFFNDQEIINQSNDIIDHWSIYFEFISHLISGNKLILYLNNLRLLLLNLKLSSVLQTNTKSSTWIRITKSRYWYC
jgi:hypothetical protein